MAAQVQDVVDVLDVDGALLHARAAVRAVPQDLLGDHAGHQGARHVEDPARAGGARRGQGGDQVEGVRGGGDSLVEQDGVLFPGCAGSGRPGPGAGVFAGLRVAVGAGDDLLGGGGLHVVAQAHDEEFGGQGLLGVPRRAQLLAPPALGAGAFHEKSSTVPTPRTASSGSSSKSSGEVAGTPSTSMWSAGPRDFVPSALRRA